MSRALHMALGVTLLLCGLLAAGGIVAYATLGSEVAAAPVTKVFSFFEGPATAQADSKTPAAKPVKKLPQEPARLVIASIGVNAGVQYVGKANSGRIGIPSNYTDVAWYKPGVVPGSVGTAVIDGHVDNGFGLSGVFRRLADLEVGEEIEVRRNDGKTLTFVVTSVGSYSFDSDGGVLFAETQKARLALVTCEGDWLAEQKTYDKRLVVFAELKQ